MTTLSNKTKKQVICNLINYAYKDRITEVNTNFQKEVSEYFYNSEFNQKAKKAFDELPEELQTIVAKETCVRSYSTNEDPLYLRHVIRSRLKEHILFNKDDLGMFKYSYNETNTLALLKSVYGKTIDIAEQPIPKIITQPMYDLADEILNTISVTIAVLLSVKTDKQLFDVSPELCEFLPNTPVNNTALVSTKEVNALNKMLHNLKDKTNVKTN